MSFLRWAIALLIAAAPTLAQAQVAPAEIASVTPFPWKTTPRTANAIANPSGAGSGGSGGMPTTWQPGFSSLATTVVGKGIENGIPFVDVRLSGTSGVGQQASIYFNGGGGSNFVVAQNDIFRHDVNVTLRAGSFTNVTSLGYFGDEFSGCPGACSYVGGTYSSGDLRSYVVTQPLAKGKLPTQRMTIAQATANGSTSYIQLSLANTSAVDITLRIGWPRAVKVGP